MQLKEKEFPQKLLRSQTTQATATQSFILCEKMHVQA